MFKDVIYACDVIVAGFAKRSYTCNYKYLEIQFWNIQFNISQEWLEFPAHVSPQIYGYSKYFTVSTVHRIASWISHYFRCFFTGTANTTSTPVGWEDREWVRNHKVVGKGYMFTKKSQVTPLVPFSPQHVTQSS